MTIKKTATILARSFALLALWGCSGENNYTVETRGGVPFIHVDGEPVRGRMFYSNVPGAKYMNIDRDEKTVRIDFTATKDTNDARIQMNFGAAIKDVWISDISLLDKSKNKTEKVFDFSDGAVNLKSNWTQKALEAWRDMCETTSDIAPDPKKYPAPPFTAKNENGVLHIQKDFVDMSVPRNQGRIHDIERLNIIIDKLSLKKGVKYSLSIKLRSNIKGRFEAVVYNENPREILGLNTGETFMTTEKYAAEVGVNIVTFGVPAFWDDEETCKKLVDSRFKPVIEANPDVKIVVRLGLEPPNWWLDKHPDVLMRTEDGQLITRMHVRFPSPSSEEYRRDAIAAMKKFIEYVEEKYPDNIAGYHPSGGNSSEWFYGGIFEPGLNGYDKATLKAWRKWLKKKYGTPQALAKAWNKDGADFENAKVPTTKERFVNSPNLLDPKKSQNVIDFNIFLQDEMSDIVLLAAKTIRETAPKKRLSVMFYGYGVGFSGVHRGPAYSGHYAFRKLLDSDDIDIFTAPINYGDRQFGGAKLSVSPTESPALAKKLWLDEDDNRTWLAPESGSPPYVLDKLQTNREISAKVMQRNMSQQIVKNNASWWMDLFGCGWFLDRELWNQFDVFKNAELDRIKSPSPYRPETAMSYDELSMCYVAGFPSAARTSGQSVGQMPKILSRIGRPFGQYLLEDILEKRATPKLNYFCCAYALTKKQREQMRDVANNSACVYIWNAGYVDVDSGKFSLDAVREATGFEVKDAGDVDSFARVTEEGKKRGLVDFGLKAKVAPSLSPIPQEGDVVLAKYGNGLPAVVLRKSGKYPQIFCGVTLPNIEFSEYAAREAGLHKYVDNQAVAYENNGYLSINTTRAGIHNIELKEESEVFDIIENKPLGKFKSVKLDLKAGEVKLWKISK